MTASRLVMPSQLAYRRHVMFAVELVDAVSLARVSRGASVVADGLQRLPVINASGLFVWLREDLAALTRIAIDTGTLPLERAEVAATDLHLPLHTVQLAPRSDYPLERGTTAIRATLVNTRADLVPVTGASVHLGWLDDGGLVWHDAPTRSRTNAHGDFACVARLAASDEPRLDAAVAMTVRLVAQRDGQGRRTSFPFQIPQGRVADEMTFAWAELQP